jgi:hypothetical protein
MTQQQLKINNVLDSSLSRDKGRVWTCNGGIEYSVKNGSDRRMIVICWKDSENQPHEYIQENFFQFVYSIADESSFRRQIKTTEYEIWVSRLKQMMKFESRCLMLEKVIKEYGETLFKDGYQVENGFIGMKRIVILKLMNFISKKIYWGAMVDLSLILGMSQEIYSMKHHSFFKIFITEFNRSMRINDEQKNFFLKKPKSQFKS